jgi:hypothetical protein
MGMPPLLTSVHRAFVQVLASPMWTAPPLTSHTLHIFIPVLNALNGNSLTSVRRTPSTINAYLVRRIVLRVLLALEILLSSTALLEIGRTRS